MNEALSFGDPAILAEQVGGAEGVTLDPANPDRSSHVSADLEFRSFDASPEPDSGTALRSALQSPDAGEIVALTLDVVERWAPWSARTQQDTDALSAAELRIAVDRLNAELENLRPVWTSVFGTTSPVDLPSDASAAEFVGATKELRALLEKIVGALIVAEDREQLDGVGGAGSLSAAGDTGVGLRGQGGVPVASRRPRVDRRLTDGVDVLGILLSDSAPDRAGDSGPPWGGVDAIEAPSPRPDAPWPPFKPYISQAEIFEYRLLLRYFELWAAEMERLNEEYDRLWEEKEALPADADTSALDQEMQDLADRIAALGQRQNFFKPYLERLRQKWKAYKDSWV